MKQNIENITRLHIRTWVKVRSYFSPLAAPVSSSCKGKWLHSCLLVTSWIPTTFSSRDWLRRRKVTVHKCADKTKSDQKGLQQAGSSFKPRNLMLCQALYLRLQLFLIFVMYYNFWRKWASIANSSCVNICTRIFKIKTMMKCRCDNWTQGCLLCEDRAVPSLQRSLLRPLTASVLVLYTVSIQTRTVDGQCWTRKKISGIHLF